MYVKELELLDFIAEQNTPNATMVAAKAGGPREYENYFGENGALTRKRRELPHPITGVGGFVEYRMVEIITDGNTKRHKLTADGERYRRFLRELVYFFNPYFEASGGKLRSER